MARRAHPKGRIVVQNRKARHDYFIAESLEAGIALIGAEVKSLRAGQASLVEAYAGPKDGELFLINAYIPEYQAANKLAAHETRRSRKLLLRRREVNRLIGAVNREGMTLIPLSIYFNERGIAKVELGLARGKRKVDKRAAEKERDWRREKARLLRTKG
ncbi:MAG: SsrA-binding protein SmpB [Proteobacteria bacterium]|nr:SsrA-binding protein SmpB [Pseudomonadota bacterium]